MIKLTNADVIRGLNKAFANQDTADLKAIESFRTAFQISVDKYLPILKQDLDDLSVELAMGHQPPEKWKIRNGERRRNYLERLINTGSIELDFDHHIFDVDLTARVYDNGFLTLRFKISNDEREWLGNLGLSDDDVTAMMRHILTAFDQLPFDYYGFTIEFLDINASYLVKDGKLNMGAHGTEGIYQETSRNV